MGSWLIRVFFVLIFTVATTFIKPFELPQIWSLALGFVLSSLIVLFEQVVRRSSLRTLMGAALGSVVGIIGATLISLIIDNMAFLTDSTETFLQVLVLSTMTYVGFMVGISKGDMLNLSFGGLFRERDSHQRAKVLDTSTIIDGRIAEIVDTGFIDGQILVPEFVLNELQMVADSADPIKRARGRRGLDILQHLQKKKNVNIQIVDEDYPDIRGVDLKLIELARVTGAKILTNDFNLNKVAQLRGVQVLNINELANVLKPVVLPGETMRVFVLKEGKEYNQGVAYLDDGTMVVIDNARRMIGKNIDIQVTSVLQTTAGKMIFGKYQTGADSAQRGDSGQEKVSRM